MQVHKTYHLELNDNEYAILMSILNQVVSDTEPLPRGLSAEDRPVMRDMHSMLWDHKSAE